MTITSKENKVFKERIANSGASKKNKPISKSKKAGLTFPIGRMNRYLREGKYVERVSASTSVYLAAVLEYLTAEILVSNSAIAFLLSMTEINYIFNNRSLLVTPVLTTRRSVLFLVI